MGVVKAKGDDAKASKYIGELILGGKIWGVFLVFFAILATFWLFWVAFCSHLLPHLSELSLLA